jgi:Protein of unknown function (DUF2889)
MSPSLPNSISATPGSSALSPPQVGREKKHTRAITIHAFARADNLWDFEAELSDIKTRDSHLGGAVRVAGDPVHRMMIRVTIDTRFNIVAVEAASLRVPYSGYCEKITEAYQGLIGLNLMDGFKKNAKDRLGGVMGCTHMTELAGVLPTAAVQAFAGEGLIDHQQDKQRSEDQVPFFIDRCHAMVRSGPAVQKFHPKWYLPAAREDSAGNKALG